MLPYNNTLLRFILSLYPLLTDPQSEADIKVWKETWSELVPSTEAGIRLHLPELVAAVCPALESQSWAIKAQGASAIATITEKMSKKTNLLLIPD